MNITGSKIRIIYSKNEITNIITDYVNVYWLPGICFFGMITSSLGIIGSFSKDFNKNPFKLIFIDSLGDFLFLLTQFFLFIMRCGSLCPWGFSYWSKIYEVYIYLFTGYTIITFRVLVDISVAFNRLLIFLNFKQSSKEFNFYLKALIFLTFSVFLNAPLFAISKEVVVLGHYYPKRNSSFYEVLYTMSNRSIVKPNWVQIILSILAIFKDIVFFVILIGINIGIAIKFKQLMKKKKTMILGNSRDISTSQVNSAKDSGKKQSDQSGNKRENDTTKMLLGLCVIFFFGHFVDCIVTILYIFGIDVYFKQINIAMYVIYSAAMIFGFYRNLRKLS
ncbi:unnamed protein product [Brachionus calyciflorus]|uniref:Uncharacterized protein n=1 Tax=Brachionus calyciflorus TaxID=104777 RepID=A0A814JJQ7_9BILA|nr:unnamed protein product [Brachionus calyciflorus]